MHATRCPTLSVDSSGPPPIATSGCSTDRTFRSSRERSENVLLIDDTWTTGANAQSAALALKAAGAGKVGVVVIGRHIREDYGDNAKRLKALPRFSWERCADD